LSLTVYYTQENQAGHQDCCQYAMAFTMLPKQQQQHVRKAQVQESEYMAEDVPVQA